MAVCGWTHGGDLTTFVSHVNMRQGSLRRDTKQRRRQNAPASLVTTLVLACGAPECRGRGDYARAQQHGPTPTKSRLAVAAIESLKC